MKIALIWPKGFDTKIIVPLALGYLKSNISNALHQIRIFDFSLNDISSNSPLFLNILEEYSPDLVGISCWSKNYGEAANILKATKYINKKIITVMGGAHATAYYENVMHNTDIDFVFRGEAETSFPIFLEEVQKKLPDFSRVSGLVYRSINGHIIANGICFENDLDKINIPDYDAIQIDNYIRQGYRYFSDKQLNAPIWATRGCPYRCTFCSAPIQNGRKIRRHSINYLVKWVEYLYQEKKIRNFNIIDDNFTFDVEYAKEFCKEILNLGLKDITFATPNGIRMQRVDKELLTLMKKAGWKYLFIAPESGSINTLKRMKKDLDPEIVPGKVAEIKSMGLDVAGFFIIGFPGETETDIILTTNLIRKCDLDYFVIFRFEPLPGTPVFEELVTKNEISPNYLPEYISGKNIPYVPHDLHHYNFLLTILKAYICLIVRKPKSIKYLLGQWDKSHIFRNVLNFFSSLFTSLFSPSKLHH